MNKLTNINKYFWIVGLIILLLIIGVIIFIFTYQIEESINAKLEIKDLGNTHAYVNSQDAYKISRMDKITININGHYETGIISNITFSDKYNMYEINILNLKTPLLPNTLLDANIIIAKTSIASSIFSSV